RTITSVPSRTTVLWCSNRTRLGRSASPKPRKQVRVRNLVTGLAHDVPAGHPALTDGQHELLPDEPVREEVASGSVGPDGSSGGAGVPSKPTPKRTSSRSGSGAGRKRGKR